MLKPSEKSETGPGLDPTKRWIAAYSFLSFVEVVVVQKVLWCIPLAERFPVEDFLFGTLPNFFAATAITALIYVLLRKYETKKRLAIAILISIGGLTLWEIIETLRDPFDFYDILFTIIGSLVTALFIMLLEKRSSAKSH